MKFNEIFNNKKIIILNLKHKEIKLKYLNNNISLKTNIKILEKYLKNLIWGKWQQFELRIKNTSKVEYLFFVFEL